MEKFKLRDCPFCGHNAIFETKTTIASCSKSGLTFTVKCAKCGVEAPMQHVPEISFILMEDGELVVTKDERYYAAATWNGKVHDVGGRKNE